MHKYSAWQTVLFHSTGLQGFAGASRMSLLRLQVYLQLQEPQNGQMKALKSNLEKARELKNAQSNGGAQGGADKGQQQMIMELYQKCAQLKVDRGHGTVIAWSNIASSAILPVLACAVQ